MRSLLPVLVCLVLAGCHPNMQNENAVKRGVMDYLSTRQGLNVASMDVSIKSMVFRENHVDATVIFTPKGSDTGQPMSIPYTLERQGNRWVVKPHAETGRSPHGGGMGMPEGGHGAAGALPPGHPAVPPQDSNPR